MRIVVIGASGTLGSAVAAALAPRHEVLRASRSGEPRVDIDEPASVRAFFDTIGTLDAVVSCAGNARFGPLETLTDEDFAFSVRSKLVNAGVEAFVRAAALEARRGIRINVVSPPWVKETLAQMGRDPGPGTAASDVARAYVAAVEGRQNGAVIAVP